MSPVVARHDVQIDTAVGPLEGFLALPEGSQSLVLFAHGSGSSRFSPRNSMVAAALNDAGIGTLLFDLLTAEEHRVDQFTREFRFDIDLLAERLIEALAWVRAQPNMRDLHLGLFGSSTGAAAALMAAATRPDCVEAVVSRGGRPDLAGDALPRVSAATLLIVGGEDTQVIELNRAAAARMRCDPEVQIVPGATHLFEEPGTLETVVSLAIDWFRQALRVG